ncbi:MAG: glycoside hydrolase family 5 protein [Polyangiaceae bacterium]
MVPREHVIRVHTSNFSAVTGLVLFVAACSSSEGPSTAPPTVPSGGSAAAGVAGNLGTAGAGTAGAGTAGVGAGGSSQTGSGGLGAAGSTAGSAGQTGAAGGGPAGGGAAGGGAAGQSSGAGGLAGSAGAGSAGAGGSTEPLTPQKAAQLMAPGWNLGNSFDGSPDETSWGNPAPSKALIDGVHTAGFKTLRLPVSWTDHIGPGPSYTIDAAWLIKVKQTVQWAVDDGMYVFVNTHHEADGNAGWVSFPQSTSSATSVATEVTAVWTQVATAFQSFNSHLMFECFNEPNEAGGGNTSQAQTDLNLYLEACVHAIRGVGGSNASRIVMIQPVGASPIQAGIQAMQKASIINDPNLVISLHTYYPTNFGLSTTPYAWGSSSDYTSMRDSIVSQIRVWLPTQVIFIGEWGSMQAQADANRAAHALAYAQDTTTAGLVPIWWDNGGSGTSSFSLFDRTSGAQSYAAIVSGMMTGVSNGLKSQNNWATLANP